MTRPQTLHPAPTTAPGSALLNLFKSTTTAQTGEHLAQADALDMALFGLPTREAGEHRGETA